MIRLLVALIVCSAFFIAGCETIGHKKNDETQAINPPNEPNINKHQPQVAPVKSAYNDVWEHLRAGYGLPDVSNGMVESQIRFYTTNRAYFAKVIEQSEPYLHFVVTEMEAANIPLELALLPFIESAYNPAAAAPGNAGMWQLGAATGRNFGLKQNGWYDGRKDVVASTEAAIKLLKKLNASFNGDWFLTIAAYNAGEGTIQQAIAKNQRAGKPTDFWSLPLTKNTQTYIPQLIALSKIIANPEKYAFKLYPIADEPYFVKIKVDNQINLAEAAQNTDLDLSKLKKMNAGFTGWLTDPTGSYQLLVPVADAAAFTLQLDNLPKLPATKWAEHIVKKGDTLETIAKKYGTESTTLKSINNLKTNNLTIGQHLQIPQSNTTSENIAQSPQIPGGKVTSNDLTNIKSSNNKQYYIVKTGENLWTIAKSQKMSVAALAKLNNIDQKAQLKPGQKLLISN